VKPDITKSIMGHTVFDRGKYINVCHSGSNFETGINNSTISNRYINELEMNFGRSLAMVLYATRYTNNIIEDAARPGFANLSYLSTNSKPTNGATPSAAFSQRFPITSGTPIQILCLKRCIPALMIVSR
jgi:AraC-like DNA-binding protein